VTNPQDPFAAPGGEPAEGQLPTYGQPPAGQQPVYGEPVYGQPTGWQGPPLAGWGTRVGGYVIDSLISLAVQLVVGLVSRPLGQVASFVVFLYFGYLTGTTGQTPGRKVVGVKILREQDGQVLGAGAGIGRGFLHILDALPLLLGFLWPIWDDKNQTFADKIIKSVPVKV
jgi:uncharacterized RDD family membrane protein YckC